MKNIDMNFEDFFIQTINDKQIIKCFYAQQESSDGGAISSLMPIATDIVSQNILVCEISLNSSNGFLDSETGVNFDNDDVLQFYFKTSEESEYHKAFKLNIKDNLQYNLFTYARNFIYIDLQEFCPICFFKANTDDDIIQHYHQFNNGSNNDGNTIPAFDLLFEILKRNKDNNIILKKGDNYQQGKYYYIDSSLYRAKSSGVYYGYNSSFTLIYSQKDKTEEPFYDEKYLYNNTYEVYWFNNIEGEDEHWNIRLYGLELKKRENFLKSEPKSVKMIICPTNNIL